MSNSRGRTGLGQWNIRSAMKLIQRFRAATLVAASVVTILVMPRCVSAAQRAFFIFQSPGAEPVPGGVATNFAVTLTYSNASGTINNAVFTNAVSVSPTGRGVTASLSPFTSPIPSGGGTATLPLTLSATPSAAELSV